jgi:hypothetical protein
MKKMNNPWPYVAEVLSESDGGNGRPTRDELQQDDPEAVDVALLRQLLRDVVPALPLLSLTSKQLHIYTYILLSKN